MSGGARRSIVETKLAEAPLHCANMLGTLARLMSNKPGHHIRPLKAISRINAYDPPLDQEVCQKCRQ
jgi:hypothetical protein